MVPGMELLEVLPALVVRTGERDLHHLPHLGRPSTERLDELPQRQASRGLWLKSVFVDVLHGARILAAVRRALSLAALLDEVACDV
jgi:hypothetical protein